MILVEPEPEETAEDDGRQDEEDAVEDESGFSGD